MKKLFLIITAFSALAFSAVAQNGNRTANDAKLTPELRAEKQTDKASANLKLSDAQKSTFKKLSIERINANAPLKEKIKASTNKEEKQNLHKQVKANNEKFHASVNSMLTPEQQTKWAEHKKKMEANKKGGAADHD